MNLIKKTLCYTLLFTITSQSLCSDSWWSRLTNYFSSWKSSALATAAHSTGAWIKENKTALLISAGIIACYIYKKECDNAAAKRELNRVSALAVKARVPLGRNPQPMNSILWQHKQITDWSLSFDAQTKQYDFASESIVNKISNTVLSNKDILRSIALSSELYSIDSDNPSSNQDVYNLPSIDHRLAEIIDNARDDQLKSLLNMIMQQKNVKYISDRFPNPPRAQRPLSKTEEKEEEE